MSLAVQRGEEEFARLQKARQEHLAGSLQAIVVAPSRELAMQIVRVGQSLVPAAARGCVQQAIGGANPHRQVQRILPLSLQLFTAFNVLHYLYDCSALSFQWND